MSRASSSRGRSSRSEALAFTRLRPRPRPRLAGRTSSSLSRSRIISNGIAAGHSQNTYRGLVTSHRKATGARNYTNCDSLLIGDKCGAHTIPYVEAKNSTVTFEHEATTSKISDDQLFYVKSRGLDDEGPLRSWPC